MKNIIVITFCLLINQSVFCQIKEDRQKKKQQQKEHVNQLIKQEEEGAIIYHKQSVFAIKLNSDGYGVFYEVGKQKTIWKASVYQFELGERKHPKEERIAPEIGINPYIYGKVNNFYYLKAGYLQNQLIGGKGNKNGVAVSALYGGGITLGLIKPYYIKIKDPQDPQSSNLIDIKYNNNDSIFLDPNSIRGASGFTMGFGEVKIKPGAFAKAALRFDYGRYNEVVSALEVGVNVEMYGSKISQMLLNKDKQLFFNVYAAIAFGKRK